MPASAKAIETLKIAAEAASSKAAENPIALDVSGPIPLTDIFFIASGRNERQVAAIADEIEEKLLEKGIKLLRREGKSLGRWILLDFGDLICHIMHEQDRMYYSLERIWSDCPVIAITQATQQSALG